MEIDLQNNVVDKTMTNEEQDKQVQQSQNYITFKDLEQVSYDWLMHKIEKLFEFYQKSNIMKLRTSISFCMNAQVVGRP